MSDEQTRLLEEIRDTLREHLELFKARSQIALQAQKRAMRALLAFLVFLILLFGMYLVTTIWSSGGLHRIPVRLEPDFGEEEAPFQEEEPHSDLPPTT